MDSSAQDLARCCYRLLDSDLFQNNTMSITDTIIDRAIEVRSSLLSQGSERRMGCINVQKEETGGGGAQTEALAGRCEWAADDVTRFLGQNKLIQTCFAKRNERKGCARNE